MYKNVDIITTSILIIFCFICGIWCIVIDYYPYAGFLMIFGLYNAYELRKQIKEYDIEDDNEKDL